MRRFTLVAAWLVTLSTLGCVEGEQAFTLNPNGSGKVKIDVVMAPFDRRPAGKIRDNESLDDLLRGLLQPLLETDGVEAWKDVSADFTPVGRFKFAGTAYFKDYITLQWAGEKKTLAFGTLFRLERKRDGSLALTGTEAGAGVGVTPGWFGRSVPEQTTDAQLDDLIMKQRVAYQQAKPFNRAMLTDLKLKIVYHLPGGTSEVREFKPEGRTTISFTLDGNQILAGREKLMTLDNAELRKYYRGKPDDARLAKYLGDAFIYDASATVAKPTAPQFDYDEEVKEARAAYPELRKKLKLGNDVRLPGEEKATPKPK